MGCSFTDKYDYVSSSDVFRVFDHMRNGELFHDCYYDIIDSENKLVFFNSMKSVKFDGSGYRLRTCRPSTHDVDYSLRCINIERRNRDYDYVQFVKETFDCYIVFWKREMEVYHKQSVSHITTFAMYEDGSVKQACFDPNTR